MTSIAQDSAAIAQNVAPASKEQINSIEDITASTYTLSQKAQQLRELLERFKV